MKKSYKLSTNPRFIIQNQTKLQQNIVNYKYIVLVVKRSNLRQLYYTYKHTQKNTCRNYLIKLIIKFNVDWNYLM